MKKLILMLLLVTTVIMAGFDEDFNENQFSSGVKAGVTLSSVVGDDAAGEYYRNEYKFGLELGAFALIHISNLISIQPELLFTQKGRVISPDATFASNIHITRNYVQLPILLAFKLAPGLKFYGGGYVSLFTNAWVSSSDMTSGEERRYEEQIEKETSNFDAGALVGAMFRSHNLVFDFRYERGLTTLDRDGRIDLFNQTFKLSVGSLF